MIYINKINTNSNYGNIHMNIHIVLGNKLYYRLTICMGVHQSFLIFKYYHI